MKISNIKTRAEFYEFSDIWYQRAHNLRNIWQNKKETVERRTKAFNLFLIMYGRVKKLMPIAIKLGEYKSKHHPCGSAMFGERGSEIIIGSNSKIYDSSQK
jgi:hypothetical protein